MRKIRDDLTGQKFGKLTVIEQAEDYVVPSGQHFTRWKCRCECGNISYPITSSLKSGKTQSCGCLGLEKRTSARKRYNEYYIIDNYVVFNTYNGESFLIDYEDLDKVKEHCWCNDGRGYFVSHINRKRVSLHRLIMDCPKGKVVDHIHGSESRYDNRKSNLRIVTASQNAMNKKIPSNNSSGTVGVYWEEKCNKWRARIFAYGDKIDLGYYTNKDDAIKARREGEDKYFGEYSRHQSLCL